MHCLGLGRAGRRLEEAAPAAAHSSNRLRGALPRLQEHRVGARLSGAGAGGRKPRAPLRLPGSARQHRLREPVERAEGDVGRAPEASGAHADPRTATRRCSGPPLRARADPSNRATAPRRAHRPRATLPVDDPDSGSRLLRLSSRWAGLQPRVRVRGEVERSRERGRSPRGAQGSRAADGAGGAVPVNGLRLPGPYHRSAFREPGRRDRLVAVPDVQGRSWPSHPGAGPGRPSST